MKFFECFAGIGGFRLGLEKLGFKCVGSCEIDKYASRLYHNYFKTKGEYFESDIKKIKAKDLPEFNLLCAGFPCQAFSISGKQKGFKDERGLLFFELIKIAKAKKAKILFFENVKNLLSHDKQKTFARILTELWELGYSVEYAVLNSKNFKLPQHRERVFIIGILRGEGREKILPILKDIASISTPLKPLKIGTVGKDSQAYRVYDSKGLSVTLKANGGGGGAKTGLYLIQKDIRRLTPLECFRLQGFDDDMLTLARKLQISDTQLYKMAGNAVSVTVIEAIGKELKKRIKGNVLFKNHK